MRYKIRLTEEVEYSIDVEDTFTDHDFTSLIEKNRSLGFIPIELNSGTTRYFKIDHIIYFGAETPTEKDIRECSLRFPTT